MSEPKVRNEEARREVLGFLAVRNLLAHSLPAVRRGVNRAGFDFNEEEIASALGVLIGLGLAIDRVDPLGSSKYYQATASGVIAHERNL